MMDSIPILNKHTFMINKNINFPLMLAILLCVASCGQEWSTKQPSTLAEQQKNWLAGFKTFESVLKISSDFKQLKIDQYFNGDKYPDYIYFAELVSGAAEVPDGVWLIQPFGVAKYVTSLEGGSNNAIAIFHSGIDQYVIVHDREAISYLDSPAIVDVFVADKKHIETLENPGPLSSVIGDVIVLPTAGGIDVYLYYDGAHYKIYKPLGSPKNL